MSIEGAKAPAAVPRNMVRDSQIRVGAVVVVVALAALALWRGVRAWGYSPVDSVEEVGQVAPVGLMVTSPVTVAVPIVVDRVVTVTVPVVEYVAGPETQVVVEVERLVEVTPAAPAVGLVSVCIYGQGLTGIYLDGRGVVDGCHVVDVGLSTDVVLTITR